MLFVVLAVTQRRPPSVWSYNTKVFGALLCAVHKLSGQALSDGFTGFLCMCLHTIASSYMCLKVQKYVVLMYLTFDS